MTENEKAILRVVVRNEEVTQKDISRETNLAVGTVKRLMGNLQEKCGSFSSGYFLEVF